jgi:hypothetical protein
VLIDLLQSFLETAPLPMADPDEFQENAVAVGTHERP